MSVIFDKLGLLPLSSKVGVRSNATHLKSVSKKRYTFKIVMVTLVSSFLQNLISYCKILISRPLKQGIVGACTIDAVRSWQIILPMPNLERPYYNLIKNPKRF